MATITLQYDARNSLLKQLIEVILAAGAKVVKPKEKMLSEEEQVLAAYQKMFGKRKDNKYTDNEIFIFNSKLNASHTIAKHL